MRAMLTSALLLSAPVARKDIPTVVHWRVGAAR